MVDPKHRLWVLTHSVAFNISHLNLQHRQITKNLQVFLQQKLIVWQLCDVTLNLINKKGRAKFRMCSSVYLIPLEGVSIALDCVIVFPVRSLQQSVNVPTHVTRQVVFQAFLYMVIRFFFSPQTIQGESFHGQGLYIQSQSNQMKSNSIQLSLIN